MKLQTQERNLESPVSVANTKLVQLQSDQGGKLCSSFTSLQLELEEAVTVSTVEKLTKSAGSLPSTRSSRTPKSYRAATIGIVSGREERKARRSNSNPESKDDPFARKAAMAEKRVLPKSGRTRRLPARETCF